MARILHWIFYGVVGIVLAIGLPLGYKYWALAPDQPFALTTSSTVVLNPAAKHIRYHIDDWQLPQGKMFFQWWNYAIVDAETSRSWTIAYGTNKIDNGSWANAFLTQRLGTTAEAIGIDQAPVGENGFIFANDCDIFRYQEPGAAAGETEAGSFTKVLRHAQRASPDGNRYDILGQFEDFITKAPIFFNLTVHRVHGIYTGLDSERLGAREKCSTISSLFGYHSEVEGVIETLGQKYTISRSSRFRAYAGSSVGCYLPFGIPPIQYPWTWFWLVIPNEDSSKDLAISAGTGRFQSSADLPFLSNLYGGYLVLDQGDKHHHMTFARGFHNTSLDTLLLAAVGDQDGYFSEGDVSQADWVTLTDHFGSALVPLTQTFRFASQRLEIVITVKAREGEYFRIPFPRDDYIYSDFRANCVRTHVFVREKPFKGQPGVTLYDGWITSPFSAVEYAYADPYPPLPQHLDFMKMRH